MGISPTTYPKILSVTPVENYHVQVTFSNHIIKVYDCSELLTHPAFSLLHDPAIFRTIQVDQGGYGVFWNDDLDISESELWLYGKTVNEKRASSPYKPSEVSSVLMT